MMRERLRPARGNHRRTGTLGRGWAMPTWYWRLLEDRRDAAGYWPELNLGSCAYLRSMGAPPERRRTCTFGCWEEPACITNAPGPQGWPPYRTRELLEAHRDRRDG